MRRAVIDIGSNTLLLLIAEPGPTGELRAVLDWCRFGRLGQGLDQTRRLHADAIARSLDICREYRAAIDAHAVERVDVIATQSLREATNAAEFAGPAAAILGAPIAIISGEREAALAFGSAAHSLPALRGAPFVVADVGGGSTEIITGAPATVSRGAVAVSGEGARMASAVSVPIGAVRLTERHLRGDPPTAAERAALTADIDRALAPLALPGGVTLVASAGTATTLAALALAMPYDPERVHGHRLTPAELAALTARLLDATVAERRAMIGMQAPRADVIAAGAAIFARLALRLGAPAIVVSDRGIRWGLAYEAALTA